MSSKNDDFILEGCVEQRKCKEDMINTQEKDILLRKLNAIDLTQVKLNIILTETLFGDAYKKRLEMFESLCLDPDASPDEIKNKSMKIKDLIR